MIIKDWTHLQDTHGTADILSIGLFWRDFLKLGSKEFPGKLASNSEIRRWIKNGSIKINDEQPRDICDLIQFPVIQLSFFSKKKGKITLI